MQKKRFILPLLTLLLSAATLLSACGTQAAEGFSDTTAPESVALTTAPAEAEALSVVKDGVAQYRVVRPELATQAEIDAAVAIRNAIEKATGAAPELTTDWIKRGEAYDSSTFEILVGVTGHDETAEVLSTIGYGDYTVCPNKNKLVVTAWSDAGLRKAASAFLETIEELGDKAGTLALPADYRVSGTSNASVNLLPLYEGGSMDGVIDCADENYMLYVTGTTPEEYSAYCEKLTAGGFSQYTSREVEGNLFSTYTGKDSVVTAYYTACTKTARVIVEPECALPPRAEDTTTANDTYTPAVRMVGLEYNYGGAEYNQIGLFLVFRLPDGRLVIVDGGGYYNDNASIIYKNLREMAPDPDKIVVAAWIFTHAHGDHTGGFNKFATSYASKIKVERFVFNFTTDAQYALISDTGRNNQTRSNVLLFEGAEVIKAHNGQLFHFGGATVEMLYTIEDNYPADLTYHNTSSLIFRVSLGGQSVMVLGDAYTISNNIASKMYGNYLKSDIVQVSHHGYQGGTIQVYNLIDADTALWPGGLQAYPDLSGRDYNQQAIKLARDLYVAGKEVYTLELPYTVVGNNKNYAG